MGNVGDEVTLGALHLLNPGDIVQDSDRAAAGHGRGGNLKDPPGQKRGRTSLADDTLFQCFFNGKNNFKQNGWSRGTSPWLLDEPSNFQDYWALRYYGAAFHEGVCQPKGKSKLLFRCDISRLIVTWLSEWR